MDFNNNSFLGTLRILLLKGEKGDKGDNGESGDYSTLINKPKINNVTVDGDITGSDLGLASQVALETVDNKVDTLQSDMFIVELKVLVQGLSIDGHATKASISGEDVSKTGYTAIGIVGAGLTFAGGNVLANDLHINQNKVYFILTNMADTTATGEIDCYVLYKKDVD